MWTNKIEHNNRKLDGNINKSKEMKEKNNIGMCLPRQNVRNGDICTKGTETCLYWRWRKIERNWRTKNCYSLISPWIRNKQERMHTFFSLWFYSGGLNGDLCTSIHLYT